MYKARFAKWGLHKYNRKDEMISILSKKTERAAVGKRSVFELQGRQVDMGNVERYLKRKGITIRDIMAWRATGATTPPGLRCSTPEPLRPYPAAPKIFHVPESLFADIRTYSVGSFEAGTWKSDGVGHLCFSIKAWDCMNDVFQEVLGPSHLSTLTSKLDRLSTATTSLDAESPDGHLENLLTLGREESGTDALRSIAVLQGLGTYFVNHNRFAELQEIGGEIVNRVTNWDVMDLEVYHRGFELMATAQFALRQFEQAKSSFEMLTELAIEHLGWENSQTWKYQAKYEVCTRNLGLAI